MLTGLANKYLFVRQVRAAGFEEQGQRLFQLKLLDQGADNNIPVSIHDSVRQRACLACHQRTDTSGPRGKVTRAYNSTRERHGGTACETSSVYDTAQLRLNG